MSLWICPEHGLYGGGPGCPQCGKIGDWAEIRDGSEDRNEPHAWDDLFEELGWERVTGDVRRT
jgi:hypothetical protein